jgi:hypothetical protein
MWSVERSSPAAATWSMGELGPDPLLLDPAAARRQVVAEDPEAGGGLDGVRPRRRASRRCRRRRCGRRGSSGAGRMIRGPLGVGRGVGVELGPVGPLLAGLGVDDDDRGLVVERGADVVDAGQAGLLGVDAPVVEEDGRAGAEAVLAVPLGGVELTAGRRGRHPRWLEDDPAPGVGGGVGEGQLVVGERQEAAGAVEDAAPRAPRLAAGQQEAVDVEDALAPAGCAPPSSRGRRGPRPGPAPGRRRPRPRARGGPRPGRSPGRPGCGWPPASRRPSQ